MSIKVFFMMVISLLTFNLAHAYDSSWYRSDYWSGEYPPGFQVYKKGIKVLGRTSVDQNEVPSVSCILKRNKYAPGLALPKATYVEMTKIVDMFAKADFDYTTHVYNPETDTFDEKIISIKAGDKIEYLAYGAEGWFQARHNGIAFDADQSIFENVDYPEDVNGVSPFEDHQWIYLSCVNNVSVWLMLTDLMVSPEDDIWIDGVRSYFHNPY